MKATIQNVKLMKINDIWKKHKPQGLGFSDNDVVIIDLKTDNGKTFSQSFYCRLKAEGTLGHSITRTSEKRQEELRKLIRKYISRNKDYNIKDNLDEWKGKIVEVEEKDENYIIKV